MGGMTTTTIPTPADGHRAARAINGRCHVCAHRLILSAKARITETSASDVLAEVLAAVPRPDRI